ncbi:MAG TPA: amidohydrolase, partial [Bacteroidota bacterium]
MRTRLLLFTLLSCVFAVPVLSAQAKSPADSAAKKPEPKRSLPLKAERSITFKTNEVTWMSLDVSPDGKAIVFDLLGDLYTVPSAGGKATRISGGMAFDAQPRFSPDGKRVVYTSDRGGNENLWIMSVAMSVTDTTAAADSTGLTQLTKGPGASYYSPEWTPDGKYIVASKILGLGLNKLWMYHVDGGSGVELLPKETNRNTIGAAFGPDSRYIYAASKMGRWLYNMKTFDFQVGVYDRETGEIFPLTNQVGGAVRPAVSPDGNWLVFASRHDTKTGYRLRNLKTGNEQWLAYPVQRDDQESRFTRDMMPGYAFTPDSKAVIAAVEGKLVRIDVPSGTQTNIPFDVDVQVDLGPRVHFETRVDDGPVKVRQIRWASLSPDGSTLAFTALDALYTRTLSDGKTTRIAEMTAGQFAPAWSPDGKSIAFVTWSEADGGNLYKVSARGGNAQKLNQVSAYYADPVWTPDGKEIVVAKGPWQQRRDLSYFNNIGGQGLDLVRIPANGGADTKIAPLKGVRFHFADKPDRLYVWEGNNGLISMRMDGTDRKTHIKVTGYKAPGAEQAGSANEVVMSSDGETALAVVNNHIYKITVPQVGAEAPTVSVQNPDEATFPVKKITTVGGAFLAWGPRGAEVNWSLGNSFFRYNIAAAKAYEDSVKKATKGGDKKKDDDAEEPMYEPAKITVDLEVPRYKGAGTVVFRGARVLTM